MKKPLIIATFLLAAFTACQHRHAAQYVEVEDIGWERSRILEMAPPEKGESYSTLHIRAYASYPYQQLAVELLRDSVRDTITLTLPRDRASALLQLSAPLPRTYTEGYPIFVRHIMAAEVLPGVMNVGLE